MSKEVNEIINEFTKIATNGIGAIEKIMAHNKKGLLLLRGITI